MTPQLGQLITIVFRNGMQIQGEVLHWSETKSSIKSTTGAAIIVIQKTAEDILYYKFSNAKTDFEKLKDKPIKNDDDIKLLATLKSELNELEREEIRERLNVHEPSAIPTRQLGNSYGNIIPTIRSTEQHTTEKVSREASPASSELQNLFSKKH